MAKLSIDQTLHGVLLAGKWVTEAGLKEHDDEWWRNGLIVTLHDHTKPGSVNYQAFQNDVLIENAAVVIFLMQARGYTKDTLKTMTPADQRNAIVVDDNKNTGIPTPVLSGLSNRQLVRLALGESRHDVIALSIDQTLHGVLLAGKWVTEAGLKEHDDEWWRNGLIVTLHDHTKPGSVNYQAFQNDVLIENAAVVIFLMQAIGYTKDTLKTMTPADQRNTIVGDDNKLTGIPIPILSGLSNKQLVRLGLAET